MASNAENVSIWWRHHAFRCWRNCTSMHKHPKGHPKLILHIKIFIWKDILLSFYMPNSIQILASVALTWAAMRTQIVINTYFLCQNDVLTYKLRVYYVLCLLSDITQCIILHYNHIKKEVSMFKGVSLFLLPIWKLFVHWDMAKIMLCNFQPSCI